MVDVAQFSANYLAPNIGNSLVLAQNLKNAKQRNALVAQDMMGQRDFQNALASGDRKEIAKVDPMLAEKLGGIDSQKNWDLIGRAARLVAANPNAANYVIGNPDMQAAIEAVGLDPALFDVTDASPEQIQQVAGWLDNESQMKLGGGGGGTGEVVKVMGPDGKPQWMDKAFASGSEAYVDPRQDSVPASVKEWEMFSGLPPEQQSQYLTMKRAQQYLDTGGGLKAGVDPVSQQAGAPIVPREDFNANIEGTKKATAEGTAQGKAITAAQEQLAGLQTQEGVLLSIMNNPSFEGAVGPLDAITGRIGEAFGSREGVLGGQVQRAANQLVTQAVSAWKGAISERELDFFQNSVPGRGSSPQTWRTWYQAEYLPRKQQAERVASGEVFQKSGQSEGGNVAPEGTVAVGPNGERKVKRGGKWVDE